MASERDASIHSLVTWPFAEAVRRLGVQIPRLPELADAEDAPAKRMGYERARTLLELAVAITKREDLGLLAAQLVPPGHFELVELASRSQHSVREGLQTLASVVAILDDQLAIKLVQGETTSKLRISFGKDVTLHPAGYDFIVASLVIAGRRQTRIPDLAPLKISLPYPAPSGTPVLAQLVSCPIAFGSDALELEFPSKGLDLPLARADASMGHVLREAARELIEQEGSETTLSGAVRKLLRESLPSGGADAGTLARKLHVSERTLRRKLDAEGHGLRALIDDVRRELAQEKLADASLSTDTIAIELGFSTAQAFHRAFRRWTGSTVQAFRARSRKPHARG